MYSHLVHESNVSSNLIVRQAEEAKRTHSVLQGYKHLQRDWTSEKSQKNEDFTMSRSKSFLGPAPMYPPSMKDPPWMYTF